MKFSQITFVVEFLIFFQNDGNGSKPSAYFLPQLTRIPRITFFQG